MQLKGIALSTLAYMILALVTIIVIISLIGNKIYPSMKDAYCSILSGVRAIIPLPNNLKTDMPSFCKKDFSQKIETVYIETRSAEKIAFNIAAYIEACWEKTGKLDVGDNMICYEIVIKEIDGEVDETMIRKYTQKPFLFQKNINKPSSIAILYNSEDKIIEVV
ncbi:MAG: hypothetical protein QXJ06_00460 [Candidatus Aenigmatarchaeota archaeon]